MSIAKKFFYRCEDCLTVAVTLEKLPGVIVNHNSGVYRYATCDACGGNCEYMGQVQGTSLVHTAYACACDGRCTGALGPSCDCSCGGENHGTGRVVEVVTSGQGLPRLMTPKDAAVKAETFRALYALVNDAWKGRYGYVTKLKAAGDYLGGGNYGTYLEGQQARKLMLKAKSMATHGGRNKRLKALLAEFQGVPQLAAG